MMLIISKFFRKEFHCKMQMSASLTLFINSQKKEKSFERMLIFAHICADAYKCFIGTDLSHTLILIVIVYWNRCSHVQLNFVT